MNVWIHRRSGVTHALRECPALDGVHPSMLRVEPFDPARPRRRCSRCWHLEPRSDLDRRLAASPRGRALAGRSRAVTERSEGNARSGLTDRLRSAISAAARGRDHGEASAPELDAS